MSVEDTTKEETTEQPEIPESWSKLDLIEMVEKGWRPRRKITGERVYITMRKRNKEKSLGPYTDEKWDLLMSMSPKLKKAAEPRTPGKKGAALLRASVSKPAPIKTSVVFNTETLAWYEWVRSKGYPGTLGDFLNEIVHGFFKREGLVRPVVIMREVA